MIYFDTPVVGGSGSYLSAESPEGDLLTDHAFVHAGVANNPACPADCGHGAAQLFRGTINGASDDHFDIRLVDVADGSVDAIWSRDLGGNLRTQSIELSPSTIGVVALVPYLDVVTGTRDIGAAGGEIRVAWGDDRYGIVYSFGAQEVYFQAYGCAP